MLHYAAALKGGGGIQGVLGIADNLNDAKTLAWWMVAQHVSGIHYTILMNTVGDPLALKAVLESEGYSVIQIDPVVIP